MSSDDTTSEARSERGGRGTTAAVLNPRSAGGRTARAWASLRPFVESACGPVTLLETTLPGDGMRLTREAVGSGHSRILAIGGDGTLNEVVNGVLATGAGSTTEVGLIPQGTGSDFRRSLGVPLDTHGAVDVIRAGKVRTLDVMDVRYTQPDGTPGQRYAINLTSFGMGGRVATWANRSSKPLGPRTTFILATCLTALGYRPDRVDLELDATSLRDIRITNVAVGNGQYHGAGMWICPKAAPDDGLLDVTVVGKLSLPGLLASTRYMFNGRVGEHPKVRMFRTTGLTARTLEGTSSIELDGEPVGNLPIRIDIVPKAIRMIVP